MTDTIRKCFESLRKDIRIEKPNADQMFAMSDLEARLLDLEQYMKESCSTLLKVKNSVGNHEFKNNPIHKKTFEFVDNNLRSKCIIIKETRQHHVNQLRISEEDIPEFTFDGIKEIMFNTFD